jgi:hypothetical protein
MATPAVTVSVTIVADSSASALLRRKLWIGRTVAACERSRSDAGCVGMAYRVGVHIVWNLPSRIHNLSQDSDGFKMYRSRQPYDRQSNSNQSVV